MYMALTLLTYIAKSNMLTGFPGFAAVFQIAPSCSGCARAVRRAIPVEDTVMIVTRGA
jgi:hypothetical protein